MSSNWQALADKFVHDLENKGYDLVANAANAAEELLEAVVGVVEDAEARFEEFKEKADQAAVSKGVDYQKIFNDTVDKFFGTEAPVEQEKTLLDTAREDYDWLMYNTGEWAHHRNANYWATYYTAGFDEDVTTKRLNEIVSDAAKHRARFNL